MQPPSALRAVISVAVSAARDTPRHNNNLSCQGITSLSRVEMEMGNSVNNSPVSDRQKNGMAAASGVWACESDGWQLQDGGRRLLVLFLAGPAWPGTLIMREKA